MGLDSRSDVPTTGSDAKGGLWEYGARRSDAPVPAHIPDDHSAYVVSLPRDTWVDIPGRGRAKPNAAFSWGGPPLLTDAVGGVDIVMSGGERRT
ncbi:LCP family protein [Streptomyces litmocidini]|uniref:LCP family protein n=1 Tax=Streptomyces litmocidini TaxID=67318 RepID=A0ABW7TX71_9ACTN